VAALAATVRVGLAGAGASAAVADRLGAESLAGDLVDMAASLAP
jgi:hypothetical protein